MSVQRELFSTISSIVSDTPELQSSLAFCDSVDKNNAQFDKTQQEIQLLFSKCVRQNVDGNYDLAENMLKNINDGRFEDFLKNKPDILDMNESSKSQTLRKLDFVQKELETMVLHTSNEGHDINNTKDIVDEIKAQQSADSTSVLDKCLTAITRLKSNFENVEIHKNLVQNCKRDSDFENRMLEVMQYVNDFTQLIEARKTIENLSNNGGKQLSWSPSLYCAISELLEQVESVNHTNDE